MYGKFVASAALGISALVSASPSFTPLVNTRPSGVSSATSGGSSQTSFASSGIHDNNSAAKSGSIPQSAINAQFPSPFPIVSADAPEQTKIEQAALGQIPKGNAKPPKVSEDSLISLGLIAFNELFEVAFFTELIHNITSNVEGYGGISDQEEVLRVLKVVQAQEELHELNANRAFQAFGGHTMLPCKYDFPVSNFIDAIRLASRFTDVVLATLPDIQTVFAQQHDVGLIRGVGSVIGQEGEQNGFYHKILGQVPSQLPFLTAGARDFALNAILQNFVIPGSCPNVELLVASKNGKGVGLRTIDTLRLLSSEIQFGIEEDIKATFEASTTNVGLGNKFLAHTADQGSGMYLTYINQQNVPFSVKISELTGEAGPIKFTAQFPGKTKDMNGLTIAAVTRSDFTNKQMSPDDVASDTLFGPALIEVNQNI